MDAEMTTTTTYRTLGALSHDEASFLRNLLGYHIIGPREGQRKHSNSIHGKLPENLSRGPLETARGTAAALDLR